MQMTFYSTARRGTAIVASLGAAALLTLGSQAMTHASGSRDSDHDGMPNRWEVRHNLDPHHANATGNPDHDGLKNVGEFRHGTKPHDSDSDGDGEDDGDEVHDGCTSTDPTDPDTDGVDNSEDESEDNCQGDDDSQDDDRAPVTYVVR
jgi:hypothetical protein